MLVADDYGDAGLSGGDLVLSSSSAPGTTGQTSGGTYYGSSPSIVPSDNGITLDQVNDALRASPAWRRFMVQRFGNAGTAADPFPPPAIRLTDDDRKLLQADMERAGFVFPDGMEIDPAGNINQNQGFFAHWYYWAPALAAAAVLTLGFAGYGPLAGVLGGGGGAGATGAAVTTTAGTGAAVTGTALAGGAVAAGTAIPWTAIIGTGTALGTRLLTAGPSDLDLAPPSSTTAPPSSTTIGGMDTTTLVLLGAAALVLLLVVTR